MTSIRVHGARSTAIVVIRYALEQDVVRRGGQAGVQVGGDRAPVRQAGDHVEVDPPANAGLDLFAFGELRADIASDEQQGKGYSRSGRRPRGSAAAVHR